MDMLIGLVVGLLVASIVTFLALKNANKTPEQSNLLLKQDISLISQELQNLKSSLNETVNNRLDKNNQLMTEAIHKQFTESGKIIADVSTRLTKLDETNKRVVDVADELKMLQNVLQNPKQRGGLGEYYLDTVLGNVLPPGGYQLQYKFDDGETVDAVIKLDKNRLLPIDSKFSLENYNRLVEEKDKSKREALAKLFKSDLKNRIDETSKYIRPAENTLDYAFMFIPSEAIYYDLLVNQVGTTNTSARDLIEYAFRDKKVIIVSPTTLLAYLQTVIQGLRSLQIEEQAKDIQKRVGELSKHIKTHETYLQKLGSSLGTTVNHFNSAHKEFKKMDKDVVKIAGTDEVVEPLLLDKPSSD
ncbi:DNA recombination protein RmuC [Candidatus Nomurabacteria bacterium]|jgi:DNA recombination protein RmuC|nr:DNA recombination protein RmuC [Candidatus Saccharibacteria bacterium]MCB9839235.1 DNA recombination protein RmuC [Candidatus Nomurabacteria bacterium]